MASVKYSDFEIKNLNSPLREKVKGRGDGTIHFRRSDKIIEAYYLYWHNRKERSIKIGNLKFGKGSGLTVAQVRTKAAELSNLKKEHPDLKRYFEQIKQEKRFKEQMESKTGTFKDMLDHYIDSLNNKNTKRNVISIFNHDVYNAFPEWLDRKPSEIQEHEIILILKKLFDRGITTNANRLRSYLSAAFNLAIKSANDPLKQDKLFNVQRNPVANIPRQAQFEKVIDRSLTSEEVKHLLLNLDKTHDVSEITAKAIKFLVYIAGQRPLQTMSVGWEGYDYRKNTILITDTKGRGSQREYLTPLTQRALAILEDLPTQDFKYPFSTDGKVPIRTETLLKAINKYCIQFDVKKFTVRDIRRTCKNLMIDAGVNRETRNLIQNHGLTGVDFKHYDKHDHLPEKIDGFNKYEAYLDKILADM